MSFAFSPADERRNSKPPAHQIADLERESSIEVLIAIGALGAMVFYLYVVADYFNIIGL